MNNNSKAVKKMQMKYLSKGLCSYGCGEILKSKTLCSNCLIKKSTRQNPIRYKRRKYLIENGLCYTDCGRNLFSKWLCKECLDKKNSDYVRKYHENKQKHRIDSLARQHKKNFGGLRPMILERDKNICQICFRGNTTMLVHHINEDPKDNRMDNLIALCRVCHLVVERMNRTKPNLRHLFPWFQ